MNNTDWKKKRVEKRRIKHAARAKTHNQRNTLAGVCPECGLEFVSKSAMLVHKRGGHTEDDTDE